MTKIQKTSVLDHRWKLAGFLGGVGMVGGIYLTVSCVVP